MEAEWGIKINNGILDIIAHKQRQAGRQAGKMMTKRKREKRKKFICFGELHKSTPAAKETKQTRVESTRILLY